MSEDKLEIVRGISRIRRASLDRFTIDGLVKFLNRLDRRNRGGGRRAAARAVSGPACPIISAVITNEGPPTNEIPQ